MSRYEIKGIEEKMTRRRILEGLPQKLMQYGIVVCVFALFCVFPLYYQDKFFNMGEAKFIFFKIVIILTFSVIIPAGFVAFAINRYALFTAHRKPDAWYVTLSGTDLFVLAYAAVVFFSFALTPFREEAFWGYEGWYMGLFSQVAFILLYFFVSRFLKWKNFLLHAICLISAIVFLLAVLHRFQIDPLHFYDNLSVYNRILFLSTIGQATWYSSYLCVVFPIGLFLFWNGTSRLQRIGYGFYVFLGFASMVTQNSDSAYIAFALMLLVLFCCSFGDNRFFRNFLQTAVLGLSAMKLIGILQLMFPNRVVPLEPLSLFMSQSSFTWVILVLTIFLLCGFCFLEQKTGFTITKLSVIPKIVAITVPILVLLSVLCVYLVTTDRAPAFLGFLKDVGYFNFNEAWGSSRGYTWRYAVEVFREYPFLMRLFGCGPDCFAAYSYNLHSTELGAKFGSSVLTNAHNEWLTSLLFFGIFGLITYLGIFVSQVLACLKKAAKEPFLIAVAMCILAYIGHNFFCYQQIVCTPLIFIIMGMGEGIIRKNKGEKEDAL